MTDPIVAPTVHLVQPRTARCRTRSAGARVGSKPFVPVVWPDGHHDQIIVVEAVTEKRLAELRACVIDKPTFVLNGVGRVGVTCSTWNRALDHLVDARTVVDGAGVLHLAGREFQWIRDGVHRGSFVPITGTVSLDGTIAIEAPDQGYYLTRRVFGAAERRDLLHGIGSMDRAGLPGWSRNGVTAMRDTVKKARNVGSARLSSSGTLSATFASPAIGTGQDQAIRLTGVVWLPTGTEQGTEIARLTIRAGSGKILDRKAATVDQDTKQGDWFRWDFYATAPIGRSYVTVELVSLGTHGDTWFDDVRTLRNDTTGFGAGTAKDLVHHGVAAVNSWQTDRGQGTFGFRPRTGWPSGTSEVMGVRHLEHTQATDYLTTLTGRDDGLDWWIDHRTREIWFSKRRGVDHDLLALHQRNVSGSGWLHDETTLTSKQITIGDGDDIDRPEGSWFQPDLTAGLVLDSVDRPANGTPLSALDPLATQLGKQRSQPQVTAWPLTLSMDLIDEVTPGDRFNASLRSGRLRMPTGLSYRCAQIACDLVTNQMELT